MILDFQGFKREKNIFIVKELAAYDGQKIFHTIFKSPFPLNLLPPELEKQARWVTKFHHGLTWEDGTTPYHLLQKIMEDLIVNADVIYIKGHQKAEFIKQLTTKPITELPEQPALERTSPKCFYHTTNNCYCSLSNVFYLYENFIMQ